MPFDPFSWLLIAAIGGTIASAIVFWDKILGWAENNLFPWFDKHLPTVAPHIRNAFAKLDKAVINVRRQIKVAWQKVREYLLKQVVKLERKTSRVWVKKVTSWVIEKLESGKPVIKEIRTEEEVSIDEVPDDVREEWLRRQQTTSEVNVTKTRDQEMSYVN